MFFLKNLLLNLTLFVVIVSACLYYAFLFCITLFPTIFLLSLPFYFLFSSKEDLDRSDFYIHNICESNVSINSYLISV